MTTTNTGASNSNSAAVITGQVAAKIQDLLAAGKTMEEALQEALTPVVSNRVGLSGEERIKLMKQETSLASLKKRIKIAHAKKSKAVKADNPEAVARYEAEIKAGKDRLNELMAQVNKSDNQIAKLKEMGESDSKILQYILEGFETNLKTGLEAAKKLKGITVKQQKTIVNGTPIDIPESIKQLLLVEGPAYLKLFIERHGRNDQRVQYICRRTNYLESLMTKPAPEVKPEDKKEEAPKQEVKKEEAPKQETVKKGNKPANSKKGTSNKKADKKNK